jgi:galactitol-specific phosphotransferase system IIB component
MEHKDDYIRELEELANSVIPQYERGVLEASVEQSTQVLEELKAVFKKYGIHYNQKIGVVQSNQKDANGNVFLVCGGIIVALDFTVKGKDRNGIDGNYSEETKQRIIELQEKIGEKNEN